jgi:hypothetical protein
MPLADILRFLFAVGKSSHRRLYCTNVTYPRAPLVLEGGGIPPPHTTVVEPQRSKQNYYIQERDERDHDIRRHLRGWGCTYLGHVLSVIFPFRFELVWPAEGGG